MLTRQMVLLSTVVLACFSMLASGCGDSVPATALATTGAYVIMAKTGVSNVTGSSILGNIAVSPAAASYITGFGLTADATNTFSTSSSVTGKIYAADYAPPTPALLTSAFGDMETTYTELAGRPAGVTELASGSIGSLTITPGVYKWSSSVAINTDVTLSGSSTGIWVFQVAGDVTIATAMSVILGGQAQAKNIYWQVAGQLTTGANAHFQGQIYSKTAITFGNLATLNGRAFAQSRVNLDNNTITQQ
jgi:hypothetical protein